MLHVVFAPIVLAVLGGDHAALHPRSVDLYFDAPDVQRALQAYASAPIVRMIGDPAIAKIGDVAGQMGWNLKSIFAGVMPVADPNRPDDRFWPWSAITHASMSLSDVDANASTGIALNERASGWLIADFKDAPAAAQAMAAIAATTSVTKIATTADDKLHYQDHDYPLTRFETSMGETHVAAWCSQVDDRLVVGLGRAQPADLDARLAEPETSFVAQSKMLADDSGFAPARGVTLVRVWSDLERVVPASTDTKETALAGDAASLLLPEFLPFVGAKGRWRLQLVDSRFVAESVYEHIGAAKDLDALHGAGTIPASTARMVPKDAIGAWLTKIDPKRFESELERFLTRATSAAATPASASTPSEGSKISAGVGESAAIYLFPLAIADLQKQPPIPRTIVAVELKDGAIFQQGLEAWIERMKIADPKLKVETKPYHKLPMYTFSHSDAAEGENSENTGAPNNAGFMQGLENALRPTITVLPDRVLMTLQRSVAQSEVRRIESKSSDIHPIASEGNIPRDAFEVSTMDWGGMIGKLYDAGRGFLPMLAQGSEKSVDVNALPTSTELFRFFTPTTSYSKRVDGKIYTYSESSFGPEMPLGMLGLGLTFMSGSASRAMSSAAPSSPTGEVDPSKSTPAAKPSTNESSAPKNVNAGVDPAKKATLDALRQVKTGLAVYRSQAGRYPDGLDSLLQGTDSFPKGFLEGGVVPKDAWGHALVYSVRENGSKYALRSLGPDGVDQQGAGDDVNVP